ncbi:sensor histidine kinase [Defluviimonas sp. SAOS-178_SWC]|uniref:sensor histidine kinase n=1 Tax=Defluviimonas sp. SAOS-178_SWC TaxID=3121287 RepID=UPI00322187F6
MSEPNPVTPAPRFWRSVRARMLVIALLPALILLPLVLASTVKNWIDRFDEVLTAKVASELTIAHQHLAGLLSRRGADIEALGQSAAFVAVGDAPGALDAFLEERRAALGLDFLYFLDQNGALHTAPSGGRIPDATRWPVVAAALAGRAQVGIDIFDAAALENLSPDLARRAQLPLVDTRAAVPTDRTEETRGMVVHAAAPARGGALVGGTLLNRNLAFIDEINTLVYPVGRLTDGEQGTATIFLDDVRISTNVRLFEDVRALGTRVSAAVRARVLDEGQVWLDRAFVVNDWYVSAYEPIVDTFGTRVGMLYVGFLESPFKEAERQTLIEIAVTLMLVLAISVPILLRWAKGIFAPLERMNAAIEKVEKGDLGARTGLASAQDEIGRVATHLDNLLDQLQERDRALRDWNEELEARVKDRTRDLEDANRQIEATTRQLIVSEKLASIGEITAGVAHEINNPLAVIQGNLDVVREDLGARADPLRTEFTLIQEQIQAIHILVSKLLHFARPEEYADSGSGNDPDAVIRDTMPLVQHLLSKARVEVELDLDAGVVVAMNHTELQQVLINLMVNAVQAMPEGGRLTVRTRRQEATERPMVCIAVSDTGTGMAPDVLGRIFDPFFTTKRSEGTGLGLSISRNLVTRGGGTITADSAPGHGTRFEILLPAVATGGQAL